MIPFFTSAQGPTVNSLVEIKIFKGSFLTVGFWADVKNGFTWKIIIVLNVRGGHGE